jgi:G:T-mismatch repair DNA endonuclease (very short patch repair protein)
LGWSVAVIWGCDLRRAPADGAVLAALARARRRSSVARRRTAAPRSRVAETRYTRK